MDSSNHNSDTSGAPSSSSAGGGRSSIGQIPRKKRPSLPESTLVESADRGNNNKAASDVAAPIPRKNSSIPSVAADKANDETTTQPSAVAAAAPIPRKLPPSAHTSKNKVIDSPPAPTASQRERRPKRPKLPSRYLDDSSDDEETAPKKRRMPSKPQRIQILSEEPLVLRIRTKGLSLQKREQRAAKRKTYVEANEYDSDDLMTDAEDAAQQQMPMAGGGGMTLDGAGPPPGELSTLWYSREVYLNMFVLDKICGWKTRPRLVLIDGNTGDPVRLEKKQADTLQQMALQTPRLWKMNYRMDLSRINPAACPMVQSLAAAREEITEVQGDATAADTANASQRKFRLQVIDDGSPTREEVLLVKWRGRSHWHCSWERAEDIINYQENDKAATVARNKIKRYYQAQEVAMGDGWKSLLEEERELAAQIHSQGQVKEDSTTSASSAVVGDMEEHGEEFFPPQILEVERILSCDEREMHMEVLYKQRAINARNEQLAANEETPLAHDATLPVVDKALKLVKRLVDVKQTEPHWDPEDNVRYVVKWKGLPYAEITWEYWRDIKQEAVDEAESFWLRQKAPNLDEARAKSNRIHPHMRDFRKLHESPPYGISARTKLTMNLETNEVVPVTTNEDDGDTFKGFNLRSYQLEGVNWLLFNWWNKRSCILADEMGLGKTIQSAAFLLGLQSIPAASIDGPFLVVAPLSLVNQWQSELRAWTPDMNIVLYHGSADARSYLVQHEFYFSEEFVTKPTAVKLKRLHLTKFNVLITTYEVVLKDISILSKIKWQALIVDEAHRLKNSRSRLFEMLATLPRQHCVLLTGTPIANATEELWALLHFANPSLFCDKDSFLSKFGEVTDAAQVNELHNLLKPFLLRRVKEDVEKSLPPKEETILEVALTPIQKKFYKAIYERNTSFLFKGSKPGNTPSLMNVMMELRKCCNHPFLVKGAEERILNEAAAKIQGEGPLEGQGVISPLLLFEEQLIKSSGKMVLMDKLLQKLFAGDHKVLVFSQMVRVLDLLEELLKLKKYKYERLDGSTSASSRLSAVDRFNRKSCQRFVMLLSTRAGGLGLNLTAADIVIIFDSDWNPQNDLQAMARAHRIGQTRAVRVYRLLTAKTYEMHMFHSASLKLGLERAVMSQNREQTDDGEGKSKKVSDRHAQAKEIDALLKKGAYDVFRDEDDRDAEKFMETDIDQLLEHSSKKVTYGTSATASIGSGLGSFSKASFVADTGEGEKDVDLDDPDFWSKAVGFSAPEETPDDVAAMLDDGVKRQRKQVQVFDPYADIDGQRKQTNVALEKQLEKEEKERLKAEKALKKKEAKDKKKREKTEGLIGKDGKPGADSKKGHEDTRPKKSSKKHDRQRALRRAELENPVIERFKQAWDVPQLNRATAAVLRFGFGRFCKVRFESNLSSLPLQDLEVFTRAWIYQLSLQVAVPLLSRIASGLSPGKLRSLLATSLGANHTPNELNWLCNSITSAMNAHLQVESHRVVLRMPRVLADESYVADLRRGGALRGLRRLNFLTRLNRVFNDCLDSILSSLGLQELGKRGCVIRDLTTLDPDLKARFVTNDELMLTVGALFKSPDSQAPASWWDWQCDVGLLMGTFIHGYGNYEFMRNDSDLPFNSRIKRTALRSASCRSACETFRRAAAAARKTFDAALEAGRIKAEQEVQAAVAAAARAAQKREADAELLRKGGKEAEAVISTMEDTQVENAFEFDGTDSHFVTLRRLHSNLHASVRKADGVGALDASDDKGLAELHSNQPTVERDKKEDEKLSPGKPVGTQKLPMPDSRILDHRLLLILKVVEKGMYSDDGESIELENEGTNLLEPTKTVKVASLFAAKIFPKFFGDAAVEFDGKHYGIGVGASQCGTSNRSLNDGSNYAFGSANPQLAQVAYGTDAPRFLRAVGVPINVTRFTVTALLNAKASYVESALSAEQTRCYSSGSIKIRWDSQVPHEEKVLHEEKTVPSDSKDLTDSVKEEAPAAVDVPRPPVVDNSFDNPELRAAITCVVLFYGFQAPTTAKETGKVHSSIWDALRNSVPSLPMEAPELFNMSVFRGLIEQMLVGLNMEHTIVPGETKLAAYVQDILLPHCLRLCVNGNGPVTRNARGSEGKYETAFGISLEAEPMTGNDLSLLPDPYLALTDHALEAVGLANAILRRVHLLGTCIAWCRMGIDEDSRLPKCERRDIDVPVWWRTSIHDPALMVSAASTGLFALIADRDTLCTASVWSAKAILQVLQGLSPKIESIVDTSDCFQHLEFPTLNCVERRLGHLCTRVTENSDVGNVNYTYHHLPMFDHGGWPRS